MMYYYIPQTLEQRLNAELWMWRDSDGLQFPVLLDDPDYKEFLLWQAKGNEAGLYDFDNPP